ncbi:hypothetical protein F5Y00DRAFT_261877 [Daldinia vernicosa]|uniref:uncharacterized protein n=1 Tax=Daldinia vernicosa TaxID=114800 RepID=UPI002008A7C2|nr:uncharacterized protein F5Y00DRAFT_261877 [Daldinia vernicosa]KAI0849065.1 hypothetical protein F5Y00DRAFT_261877 [Daldinia vernicosa]
MTSPNSWEDCRTEKMLPEDQLKESLYEPYSCNFDVGTLDTPLDNEPFMPVEMHDQVIDPPHQNTNEFDTAYPEHMLSNYMSEETFNHNNLENLSQINYSNLACPIYKPDHNPDHTHIGGTSDYERYHAKFFDMNSEPESEDPVPGPVQEPVQEPEKYRQYPEAFMDPRLFMHDPPSWVYPKQENNGPDLLSMPQPSSPGLIQNIQSMEPLLAEQSWVSYVTPAPYTEPMSYPEPSYTGLRPRAEQMSNAQSAFHMNPVLHPKPVSYSESMSYPAPVSYPDPVSYVGPVSYPEPISYPESVSPPASMPYKEAVVRPQPRPLEGNSSHPFRLRPDPITMPATPPPGACVQSPKYDSYYFNKVPAMQYGQRVGQFISEFQVRSKTPCAEPVVNSPGRNQRQTSLSPEERLRNAF